jgi:hypothetical protein
MSSVLSANGSICAPIAVPHMGHEKTTARFVLLPRLALIGAQTRLGMSDSHFGHFAFMGCSFRVDGGFRRTPFYAAGAALPFCSFRRRVHGAIVAPGTDNR